MADPRCWTEEEDEIIRKHYASDPTCLSWAHLLPRRSFSGIDVRCTKLGVRQGRPRSSRRQDWAPTLEEIRERAAMIRRRNLAIKGVGNNGD